MILIGFSCQAKRSVLFAEKLAPAPHRHWTFSIPRPLRGLIERDRQLLGLLSQTAWSAILKTFQAFFDPADVRPGGGPCLRPAEVCPGLWAQALPTPGNHGRRGN